MPGKGDYGSASGLDAGKGQFFPGDNEWKAWDAGVQARFALQDSNTNPFSSTDRPREWKAWDDGWKEADSGNVSTPRMPYIYGTPGAIGSPP